MNLVVISDEQRIFDGEAISIVIDTDNGPVEILDNHVPAIFKAINSITIKTKTKSEQHNFACGFAYTNGSVCFVIFDK